MKDNMRMMKVTVARSKCPYCGSEKLLYYMSDYSYGERLVTTTQGNYCAYVNLLDEAIIPELEKLCKEIFTERKLLVADRFIDRIIPDIYGITCDAIHGEKIDTASGWKCYQCEVGILEEDKAYGEKVMELEAAYVSHDSWDSLSEYDKRRKVEEELVRQGFL